MKENPFIQHLASRATGYGYIIEKDSYKLQYVNPPLVIKLKTTEEEVCGKLCYSTIFGYDSPCPFCRLHQTPLEESTSWYLHHEKENAHYMMDGFLTCRKNQEYFVQMTTGITQEIKEIALLKNSIVAEKMVTACANTLTQGAHAMDELLRIVCDFFDASHATVWCSDNNNHHLALNALFEITKDSYPFPKGEKINSLVTVKHQVAMKQNGYLFLTGDKVKEIKELYIPSILDHLTPSIFITEIVTTENQLGLLVLYNLKKHLYYLHHIHTVNTFIANRLSIQNRIHTLATQNELSQLILSCVSTLEGNSNFEDALHGLLAIVDAYFCGDRTYILLKVENNIELEFEYTQQTNLPTNKDIKFASAQKINQWFEDFGSEDTLSISSKDLSTLYGDTFEYQLLMQDKVTSLLGVRLFEQGSLRRFLMIDNPTNHTEQVALLKGISSFVESHLDRGKILKKLEELSYTDSLTGLYNRNFYHHYLEHLSFTKNAHLGVVFGDVNGLKRANDNFGHEFGDILLHWSGQLLQKQLGGMVFRIGGDEFVCFIENITKEHFTDKITNLNTALLQEKDLHISIGYTWEDKIDNIDDIMKKVDQKMYIEKKAYYQEKAKDSRTMQQELQDFKEGILRLTTKNEMHP